MEITVTVQNKDQVLIEADKYNTGSVERQTVEWSQITQPFAGINE